MHGKKKPIHITPAAIERLTQVSGGRVLYLSLKAKGCANMGYVMNFVDRSEVQDEVFEIEGVRVAMSPQATLLMLGCEIDFVHTPTKSHFTFHNPQAKGMCGCGQSFRV